MQSYQNSLNIWSLMPKKQRIDMSRKTIGKSYGCPQEVSSAVRNWLPAIYFSGATLVELCMDDL